MTYPNINIFTINNDIFSIFYSLYKNILISDKFLTISFLYCRTREKRKSITKIIKYIDNYNYLLKKIWFLN